MMKKTSVLVRVVLAGWCQAVDRPIEATWAALQHEPSEWAYSVPACETEWYAMRMYDETSSVYRHHVKTYGHPKEFGYRKLVPLFKAEKWDPTDWAKLMKASGARYADFLAEWQAKVREVVDTEPGIVASTMELGSRVLSCFDEEMKS